MPLVDIPQNPLPPEGIVEFVTADRIKIRTARWFPSPDRPACGTVVICPGRTEFVEKYAEVIRDLLDRQFVVVIFDWRGQGGSTRLLRHPRKGHIRHFGEYERDLLAVGQTILAPHCPKPWYALAHSMGGTILLHHARESEGLFERIVLSAPMVDIFGLSAPRLTRMLAAATRLVGLQSIYVPGGSDESITTKPFPGNVLTSDPRRFAAFGALAKAAPDFMTGSPTWGWLRAAFRAMAAFSDPAFARHVQTPTLVVACGGDRVCDTRATERLAVRLRAGRLVVIPHAEHEVLMEQDRFRDQFWSVFDAFIPGSTEAAPAALPRPSVPVEPAVQMR